jgi:hypothetical protein
MSEGLIKEFDVLLKSSYLSCPSNIFLQSSVYLLLEEAKALTKEKFLAVYKHLKENYRKYEEVFYKEVMEKLEEHLKRLKG